MANKKAAVFILLGQSNAVGHGAPMEEKDIISTPLKNVFGLSRAQNQSFNNTDYTAGKPLGGRGYFKKILRYVNGNRMKKSRIPIAFGYSGFFV